MVTFRSFSEVVEFLSAPFCLLWIAAGGWAAVDLFKADSKYRRPLARYFEILIVTVLGTTAFYVIVLNGVSQTNVLAALLLAPIFLGLAYIVFPLLVGWIFGGVIVLTTYAYRRVSRD